MLFSLLRKSFFAKLCCSSRAMLWSRIREVWVLWVSHCEVSRWGDGGLITQFLLGLLILFQEAVDVSGDLCRSPHWSMKSFPASLIIFKKLLFIRVDRFDCPVHYSFFFIANKAEASCYESQWWEYSVAVTSVILLAVVTSSCNLFCNNF